MACVTGQECVGLEAEFWCPCARICALSWQPETPGLAGWTGPLQPQPGILHCRSECIASLRGDLLQLPVSTTQSIRSKLEEPLKS